MSCAVYFIAFLFIILLFFILIYIFYFIFSYLYLCIFSCVYVTYNCTVHGVNLTYISLLFIFCIIVYVTNTNLESGLSISELHASQLTQELSLVQSRQCHVVTKVYKLHFFLILASV